MSRPCTTHHHACDCREEKFRALEQELEQTKKALEAQLTFQRELRADRDRLDWLADNPIHDIGFSLAPGIITFNGRCYYSLRSAIDDARGVTS